jgi:hypothetical protein
LWLDGGVFDPSPYWRQNSEAVKPAAYLHLSHHLIHLILTSESTEDKMWLLNTSSLALSAFFDNTPHYVILSHTWGSEEVSFQDIKGSHDQISHRAGYKKIKDCCAKASEAGFRYVWIDTCCIDKTNSTELSEAINSMFRWYKNSTTCYAYLEDVLPEGPRFVGSRWFTRGWTLQELIAPTDVLFFDRDWNDIGTRESLKGSIEKVTGIPEPVLMNRPLREHCVAEIMSWAADRRTTRIEDRVYSLLGLFGVNMPLIYGEGENAFLRLQLEIMKNTTDHSILAWTAFRYINSGQGKGALATTVDEFRESGRVRAFPVVDDSPFEMTNLGLRITLPCISERTKGQRRLFAYLNCTVKNEEGRLGMWLTEAASAGTLLGRFERDLLDKMPEIKGEWKDKPKSTTLYIIQPYFRESPQQEIDTLTGDEPCCLEYSDLVEAGYLLEAYATDAPGPHIWQEECKINFLVTRLWTPDPKIFFFRHIDMARRIWIMFVRPAYMGKLWLMVDGSSNFMDTPEFISNYLPLGKNGSRLKHGYFTDHTFTSKLYDDSLVKVSLRKAMVGQNPGLMVKITTLFQNPGSYLEEISKNDYIALGDALSPLGLRLLEDEVKPAHLIRVL